jgi:hypothetical protein
MIARCAPSTPISIIGLNFASRASPTTPNPIRKAVDNTWVRRRGTARTTCGTSAGCTTICWSKKGVIATEAQRNSRGNEQADCVDIALVQSVFATASCSDQGASTTARFVVSSCA